ncbi:non-homologous end-joining DNA ligase [Lentzea sp. BCCO 10_0061]|uniref:DNA ligase (ATP) n=1 Tax=Lentzea sokolovensis TaxID=3095429 RepID=A0ABU4V9X6_9PSEU|nr:non-homologous end-joining DNA ligase [Lentzea sp. BCCO 10_0061]MDX8148602.1 non-homologous end-joining DNA ligase [Lentzea sp. BCCO 10_0061]
MAGLDEYRRKRDPARTPEPVPSADELPRGDNDTFVIQEHHASSLHWDVRLERDGVLVSWAVPKGLPSTTDVVRLAVHTEDHPLEYAQFSGEIPKGEYGGGEMVIWDRGRYETVKWSDREVDVVLHGRRVQGQFVFFRSGKDEKNWMMKRRHAAARPDWQTLPEQLKPMLAVPGPLPQDDDDLWAYEFKWDGVRAILRVEGGRVQAWSRLGNDITVAYPELQGVGEQLGSTEALLDGEIVALQNGRPSFSALQNRMHVTKSEAARRAARQYPATLLLFDLLHLDGSSTMQLPFRQRRELLRGLELKGPNWLTPPSYDEDGASVLAASREQGLEGVVAKRLDSVYQPGMRSPVWRKITDLLAQEVVIGGWRMGEGKRAGVVGALLLGIPQDGGLAFAGSVGTGFNDAELAVLTPRLKALARKGSPFVTEMPRERAKGALWVEPELVAEVVFRQWTPDGRMRFPAWRGLRPDKAPEEVRRVDQQ